MVQLGFSLQAKYACSQERVIELLHDAGFSAVSPVWTPELDLDGLAAYTKKYNMIIQSLHAPHGGSDLLWDPQNPLSAKIRDNILRCIDDCARFHIPLTVLHGWQGLQYTFPEGPLDFSLFDQIVDHGEQKKVTIAFENLEGEEYLEALLTRYQDRPYVGYCWDAGHDHCYPHKMDFLAAFGQRLRMTHINDNLGLRDPSGIPSGDDDLHFLPFDGNIRWDDAIRRLENVPKQKILNFEIKTRSFSTAPEDLIYEKLSPEAFFQLAGQRARMIADLYDQMMDAHAIAPKEFTL